MTTPATSGRYYLFADWQERGRVVRCWYGEGMGWASLWGANTYREAQATAIIRAWTFHETLVRNPRCKRRGLRGNP